VTQFHGLQFYSTLAQEMAREMARFYHPEDKEPLGSLTVPEVLAVFELAAHDLADLVDKNVPGSHLLTINDWRWTKLAAEKATTWYRQASNFFWLASAMLSPVETALRYAASQAGTVKPMQLFQQNLIAWFHLAFVQRLGSYLIELNSGRLKVGARRYRELKAALEHPDGAPAGLVPAGGDARPAFKPVELVTLTIMGQTKVGKSSFINALLGEQRARTDVIPATDAITRYELLLPSPFGGEGSGVRGRAAEDAPGHPSPLPLSPKGGGDSSTRLVLLDTVGYAHSGPKEDQVKTTRECAQKSDLVILVLHARNPARQADLEMLQALQTWFAARPDLKMPPVLAVMTHVDLLSPAMEWSPPYNWQKPEGSKEKQIQEALTAVRDQLDDYLVGAVPLCTSPGKVYGIEEWFLPTLAELLGEARAVALLRCLRAEFDTAKARKVVQQALAIGTQVLEIWLKSRQPIKK
jgi:predicted GTPase